MSYVITSGCCSDAACVEVCPVDCIRPRPEDPAFRNADQLYIDPYTCIGCSACMFACPVSVIHDSFDIPAELSEYIDINAEYFENKPLSARFVNFKPARTPPPVTARIAVVGAGPAACYAIAELCKIAGIQITVFDRLPTPFGLVRSGVAPDHPSTKQVSDLFQSTLEHPNVTCYFNVEVGKDVSLDDLRQSHHAVIYAGGAAGDRAIGVEGEELPGSASAREFVSWYNGHPDFTHHHYNLTHSTAVIIGNGNVALDVARSLVTPVTALEATDMADHAIKALRGSAVDTVVIAARRTPHEAACTAPELSELCRVPGVEVCAIPSEVSESATAQQIDSGQKRKLDVFARMPDARQPPREGIKRIVFRFGAMPIEYSGTGGVASVTFRRSGDTQSILETIECGLVIRAVGYRVSTIAGIPFDTSTGTISHRNGRVVDAKTRGTLPGLFCVGWAKRGASGVIGTNKVCSRETVAALLDDLTSGHLPEPKIDSYDLARLIRARQPNTIELEDWNRIDAEERRRGNSSRPRKVRRKIVSVEEMLHLISRPSH